MQYDPGSGISDRVRRAMAKRGMSIRQLADLAEVPYRSLQNYLLETRSIPAETVERIAGALEVSADWLLSGLGARFDKSTLINALSVIEDVRGLSDNKTSIAELAAMFENFYVKFYSQEYPTVSRRDEAQQKLQNEKRESGKRKRRLKGPQ